MQERAPLSRQKKIYGGIAASVAVHAVIVAALLISLPVPVPVTPPEEETVSVEMVPPEEAPPETPAEEEKALDLTMPEEKPEQQKAEIPPPPEPPQQEAEEQGAPPQPETPQQEAEAEAQAEPPPPPEQAEQPPQPEAPPPEAEQQAEAEPPPPPPPAAEEQPPEQAEQQPPEQQPPAAEQSAETSDEQPTEGQSIPVLRPVFEFGENDAGPEVTQDGDAAEQGQEAETPADPTEADAATEPTEQAAAETETSTEEATTDPDPAPSQDIAAPEIDGTSGEPLASNSEQPADGAQVAIVPEPRLEPPAPKASENETEPAEKPLKEAKRLFSREDTQDPVAVTAMGGIPRDMRASQLCATELREQLRHASPAYQPEFLPAYRLPEGTVLDIKQAAFRASGQWYDVGFRCEIDPNATKVVSFGFDVGQAVPRSQWRARGFPEL